MKRTKIDNFTQDRQSIWKKKQIKIFRHKKEILKRYWDKGKSTNNVDPSKKIDGENLRTNKEPDLKETKKFL